MQKDFAKNYLRNTLLGTLVATSLPSSIHAFQLQEQSVSHLGMAYAGTGSMAKDASISFYNPAGLIKLKKSQVSIAGLGNQNSAKLRATNAMNIVAGSYSLPLYSDNAGVFLPIPALHYVVPLTEGLVFGFSVTSPFAFSTRYTDSSPASAVATTSRLITADLSPSLGYRYNHSWSFGAGLDLQRGFLTLNNGEDVFGVSSGFLNHELKGIAYGYHLGVLYEPFLNARLGMHYRSQMNYRMVGDYTFALNSTLSQGKASSSLSLPNSFLLSAYYEVLPAVDVALDLQWTRWACFDQLRLNYAPLLLGTYEALNTNENFKNTIRLAVGAIYRFNREWTYRVGAALDQTPTRLASRTARFPDEDKRWVSIGAQYKHDKNFSLDFGFAHLFYKTPQVADTGAVLINASGSAVAPVGTLNASYRSYSNIFGMQVNWKFD